MSLITFTSDFGRSDHYVAAVKARVFRIAPEVSVVDVTHDIESFNIIHGAYVLRSVFKDFPEKSVHIVSIDTNGARRGRHLAVKLEGHFFIGPDNGIFSLISDEKPAAVVALGGEDTMLSSSPAKELYAEAAAKLVSGKPLTEVGDYTSKPLELRGRIPKLTKDLLVGNVLRVDHYGNLIVNISKLDFEKFREGRSFVVSFGREKLGRFVEVPNQAVPGEVYALFNSDGLLEIGINKGRADELLGMVYDSPVRIGFIEAEDED
ncbi:hypothetical protein FUAX_23050 [Fulvitalea axinellae]|uniref:S-adenosyl-l-methionine hydroxide adenosyltransferase n=1 Tax=Fulvitalea axinellae TaxID=1182444 RepID=A0AAU9CPA2_9BACT|nr:hypothetical protein FUAX_23050 [Fulvitalea axinellae]